MIAGELMGAFGAWTLFAWFALTHATLAVYALWRSRVSPRTPADMPAFQPMLRTTPAALRLLRAAVRARRGA